MISFFFLYWDGAQIFKKKREDLFVDKTIMDLNAFFFLPINTMIVCGADHNRDGSCRQLLGHTLSSCCWHEYAKQGYIPLPHEH